MKYEWDEDKRARNIFVHGVDFTKIETFDWATCLTVPDQRFEEARYFSLGLVEQRLYAVVYTIRGTTMRLISLRKANKREVRNYENYRTD
ncbi:hypothetical protein CLV84_4288 [Neolewinella xylanilytica]|uniref:Uncharacterized protein n=1 Tax=Neolewinella xylanilytica TaxID=1514080 RepID=A0A2S6HZZ5_9BACT|nr:hypothetical protein CLV84_4288 [Neolewinella xylanilytica]